MNVNVLEENGGMTATLQGRLDTAAALEVAPQFSQLQENADKNIIVDCSELEYISSSGLRLFIALRKASAAKGGSIVIRHMSDSIRNVFTMTGFIRLFTIED